METVTKTIKQYSYPLEKEIVKELAFIGNQYKNVKNYVYSRFSGINSILPLITPRKIRDEWVKTEFYKQWIKGYIRIRLQYKCSYNNIKYSYINPAYTSQVCNVCNSFGNRVGEEFTCNRCGTINADYNASVNILNRLEDSQINLYTNYRKVKNILQNRLV